MEKIKIGQIVNVVGLGGDLKVYSYAESPDRFKEISRIFIEDQEYEIESVRFKANMPIVKVKGINDRNQAEAQKTKDVYMAESDLPKLPEGEFYIKDLIGSDVVTEEGEKIGTLADISTSTAQKLYIVTGVEGKTIYIPGVSQFIISKDGINKVITVRLPEGIMEI